MSGSRDRPSFKIQFHVGHGRTSKAVAEVSLGDSSAALFEAIKMGYLAWRRQVGEGSHDMQVFAYAPKRLPRYPELVEDLVTAWNGDGELQRLVPMRFEFWIGTRARQWLGFTNGRFPHDPGRLSRQVRALKMEDREAELEAHRAALAMASQIGQQQLKVGQAVDLPADIRSEVVAYLNLEFGESSDGLGVLTDKDLTWEGEFLLDGVPTQYWRFPTSVPAGAAWATVGRYSDHYVLGMTTTPPQEGSQLR